MREMLVKFLCSLAAMAILFALIWVFVYPWVAIGLSPWLVKGVGNIFTALTEAT